MTHENNKNVRLSHCSIESRIFKSNVSQHLGEDTNLMRKTAREVAEPEGRKWQGFGSLLVAFKMLGLEHRGVIYSLC